MVEKEALIGELEEDVSVGVEGTIVDPNVKAEGDDNEEETAAGVGSGRRGRKHSGTAFSSLDSSSSSSVGGVTSPGCRCRRRFLATIEEMESFPPKNDFSLFRFLPPLAIIVVVVTVVDVVSFSVLDELGEGRVAI